MRFKHSRKGVALKNGETVNKANCWSEDMRRWLVCCAAKVRKRIGDPNIDIWELINEGWLKSARYFDRIQTIGTKGVMYRYVQKEMRERLPRMDDDVEILFFEGNPDCFYELYEQVKPKITDAKTLFMLDLYFIHGMSMKDIGVHFDLGYESVRLKIKEAIKKGSLNEPESEKSTVKFDRANI